MDAFADDPSQSGPEAARSRGLEHRLLSESGLFDHEHYCAAAGDDAQSDPVLHYLNLGWRTGCEPNPNFPGNFLLHYFTVSGFAGPAAITWLVLRSAGWPMPATRAEIVGVAARIADLPLFDGAGYAVRAGLPSSLDPAIHYSVVGERLGLSPSFGFDPTYYAQRNPDVAADGMCLLLHYELYGRREGRRAVPIATVAGARKADPAKANVLLVVHETSRTGAPILGWNIALDLSDRYNLTVVRLGDGELTREFEQCSVAVCGPFLGSERNAIDLGHALRLVLGDSAFQYAIVNSAECRLVIAPCAANGVPSVFLVHEFAAYLSPVASLREALDWSAEIVFPAPVVARAAARVHPQLAARNAHILPQGASVLPPSDTPPAVAQAGALQLLGDRRARDGAFVVLGAGQVQIRKGVDVFIATAAASKRLAPVRPLHFLWVGQGFRPDEDLGYAAYLREQIERSEVGDIVSVVDEVSDLDAVYGLADAFLLSSRLDPMPNVSIDAAMRGIPLVCFREASGIAELLLDHPDTQQGVVGYMDASEAARVLVELAGDAEGRGRMSQATREMARRRFDMRAYVSALDAIGCAAAARMRQRRADMDTLLSSAAFDQSMVLGPDGPIESARATAARYLAISAARGTSVPGVSETPDRRPSAGFHPRLYAQAQSLEANVDGFADFLRRGRPAGPWQATVLCPDDNGHDLTAEPDRISVALHAHLFFPELASALLSRLHANRQRPDLFVSTDTPEKAATLARRLASYQGSVRVRVMPNRGRDLGPLLTGFAPELRRYDLIGHVHGKRSMDTGGAAQGDSWREFLWQNLLGGLHPMADRVIRGFGENSSLGLVFTSDPHLLGWDLNRAHADSLAGRMGLAEPLPEMFDFPVGSMFWARTQALRPLLDLGLGWDEYPDEPAPYDGSILHAIERLLPSIARHAGYGYAVTHVPCVSR